MPACCNDYADELLTKTTLTVALAGNPNSGKTTIFNALTGLRQKVANYPGVTVEKKIGTTTLADGRKVSVIDLPGTYSLISRSPDEQVAMEILRGLRPDTPAPDVVVVVVDASNLQRNLYLVSQLIELGRPMVVALNMMDVARRRGSRVSPERLSGLLGVPVVPVVGHKREGIDELKKQIVHARVSALPEWPLPDVMREELQIVGGALAILDEDSESKITNLAGSSLPHSEENANVNKREQSGPHAGASSLLSGYFSIAERLLIGDIASDIQPYTRQKPVENLLNQAKSRLQQLGIDPMQADIEAHYHWIDQVASGSLVPACEALLPGTSGVPPVPLSLASFDPDQKKEGSESNNGRDARGTVLEYAPKPHLTERVDRILLHKVWGLAVFVAIMAGLFVSIFWLAGPLMDGLTNVVTWVGGLVTNLLPEGPIHDLWNDGIVAGVGAVIVFVPQIALLFLFLAIMEDSGYLARAAFLMDRLLAKVGLHGKSFIPMLSSFACAIPGIMAARTIENRKDRLATIFVAPFMSCSARLPVYTLLIGTFFGTYSALGQGGIMLSLYLLGILAAVGTAYVFRRTLLKGGSTAFILELPTYKVPQPWQVARVVWTNTKAFVTKAGTTIFCLSVILWAMSYYPRLSEAKIQEVRDSQFRGFLGPIEFFDAKPNQEWFEKKRVEGEKRLDDELEARRDSSVAAEQLRQSIAGRFGHLIEPVIKPLGYDWKMGVGLVGAFAAREVFVSTMGIVYSVGQVEDDTAGLADAMKADVYNTGKPVWTTPVAVSLLIWFVLAMQCMSTLAIVRRETGGWKWPIFMLVYMNGLAYVVCLVVYQAMTRVG